VGVLVIPGTAVDDDVPNDSPPPVAVVESEGTGIPATSVPPVTSPEQPLEGAIKVNNVASTWPGFRWKPAPYIEASRIDGITTFG
jgi:hypothetical protein